MVPGDGLSELVEAVLAASRALVGVAAESLAQVGEDVTLPQYRALVVVAGRGPMTLMALAEAMGVNPSTASRLCDRLVDGDRVRREPDEEDRRQVRLTATPGGHDLVGAVTAARRDRLGRILRQVPAPRRAELLRALQAFNTAAGEVPEQTWAQASIL
ncbi:MAG: MarR family winged helix-turn-helix transcriptional regulator [Acidimicrobiales bacterium]